MQPSLLTWRMTVCLATSSNSLFRKWSWEWTTHKYIPHNWAITMLSNSVLLSGYLVLLSAHLSSSAQISVVKHWSTAVSQSGTAKLACKANNGAQIRSEWSFHSHSNIFIFSLHTAVNVNGNIHGEDLSSVLMAAPAVATMRLSAWVGPPTPDWTTCATSPSTVWATTTMGTGSALSTRSVTTPTMMMMGLRMDSSKAGGGGKWGTGGARRRILTAAKMTIVTTRHLR